MFGREYKTAAPRNRETIRLRTGTSVKLEGTEDGSLRCKNFSAILPMHRCTRVPETNKPSLCTSTSLTLWSFLSPRLQSTPV